MLDTTINGSLNLILRLRLRIVRKPKECINGTFSYIITQSAPFDPGHTLPATTQRLLRDKQTQSRRGCTRRNEGLLKLPTGPWWRLVGCFMNMYERWSTTDFGHKKASVAVWLSPTSGRQIANWSPTDQLLFFKLNATASRHTTCDRSPSNRESGN